MSQQQICIVSAYGRGNWLAAALSEKNYKVKLVDVSHCMGRWAPEDWEGPFGFFQSEQIRPLQLERLNEQDYADPIDEGFIVWLKDGPIDTKGPLSSFYLEKQGLKEICDRYLQGKEEIDFSSFTEELSRLPFNKSWIVYLSYMMASNEYSVGSLNISKEMKCLPLFSPLYVRRVSRRGTEKSLDWCESKNVGVLRNARVIDVSMSGRSCDSIEIESSWSGVLKADQYIWMVTSEETARLSPQVSKAVFPLGILNSSWSWMRYKISLSEEVPVSALPVKFVMIEDIYLPWSHENFCLAQRSVSGNVLDAWIRLPSQHRFQRTYLEESGERLCKLFDARIPNLKAEIVDMPQDFHYDESELGPNPIPMYDRYELENHALTKFKNIHFESPENGAPWIGQGKC